MIKKCLGKIISLVIITITVMTLSPIEANASWSQNNIGWWYTEGSSFAIGWKNIEGKWYYFYQNGYMAKNTQVNGYKIDLNGVMEDTPVKYQHPSYKWTPKNETILEDGNNNYYYIENDKIIGEMLYKDNYLYYTENGKYFDGWKKLGDAEGYNWYYIEQGRRCLGWKKINGKWYYFYNGTNDSDTNVERISGKMVNTSLLEAGKSYEFDDYGVLQSTV